MSKIRSCGFLVFRDEYQSFLLMRHLTRWDLPKGHVDPGETELECALRELEEETGIRQHQIQIDKQFRFVHEYTITTEKHQFESTQKQLIVFLACLADPDVPIVVTEHASYQWFDWNPPHHIQAYTIDPLLDEVQIYLSHRPGIPGNR